MIKEQKMLTSKEHSSRQRMVFHDMGRNVLCAICLLLSSYLCAEVEKSLQIDCQGGSGNVVMYTSVEGTASGYFKNDSDWIWAYQSTSLGYDGGWNVLNGVICYDVDENKSVYARDAIVQGAWYWRGSDDVHKGRLKIHQMGAAVSVSVTKESFGVSGGMAEYSISTADGIAWGTSVVSWDAGDEVDWLSFSVSEGDGDGIGRLIIKPNVLGRRRAATIEIASKCFQITQMGNLEYEGLVGVLSASVKINGATMGQREAMLYVDGMEMLAVEDDCEYL